MITQEKKDLNITCTGKGINCYNCVDNVECIDYVCDEQKELIKYICEETMCEILNKLTGNGYEQDKIHISIRIESDEYGISEEQTTQI